MAKPIVYAAVLTAFLMFVLTVTPVHASQGSAQAAINQAKNTLKNCYTAISAAEAAGANVDSLALTLNGAAMNISNANLAYSGGNYDAAYNYASQAQSKLSGFEVQADQLQQNALADKDSNEVGSMALLAGATALFCIGVATWTVLDKKERRAVNGAVPA